MSTADGSPFPDPASTRSCIARAPCPPVGELTSEDGPGCRGLRYDTTSATPTRIVRSSRSTPRARAPRKGYVSRRPVAIAAGRLRAEPLDPGAATAGDARAVARPVAGWVGEPPESLGRPVQYSRRPRGWHRDAPDSAPSPASRRRRRGILFCRDRRASNKADIVSLDLRHLGLCASREAAGACRRIAPTPACDTRSRFAGADSAPVLPVARMLVVFSMFPGLVAVSAVVRRFAATLATTGAAGRSDPHRRTIRPHGVCPEPPPSPSIEPAGHRRLDWSSPAWPERTLVCIDVRPADGKSPREHRIASTRSTRGPRPGLKSTLSTAPPGPFGVDFNPSPTACASSSTPARTWRVNAHRHHTTDCSITVPAPRVTASAYNTPPGAATTQLYGSSLASDLVLQTSRTTDP